MPETRPNAAASNTILVEAGFKSFVSLSENDHRRLAPGPFDEDLAGVVKAIDAEQRPITRSIAGGR